MVPGRLQANSGGHYDSLVSVHEPSILLLRSDADRAVGAGHVMRGLALAQAWQDQGGCVLHLGALRLPGLAERLDAAGVRRAGPDDAADARETARIARSSGAAWVAIDGYGFDAGFQESVADAGARTLILDDTAHLPSYRADLLLNPNLHATAAMYVRKTRARLLLGTRFTLLRREFWADPAETAEVPGTVTRVLVTLGGSGAVAPLTSRVVDAVLQACPDAGLTVIGGAVEGLGERVGNRVRALRDATGVADLMRGTQLAISAAGGTCWELARCGVPMIVIALADNQRPVGRSLGEGGAALDLGWHEGLTLERLRAEVADLARDPRRRREMAWRAGSLVDAEGGRRVAMTMTGARFRLRDARPDDLHTLLDWVNEPGVRASAFSGEPIDPEEHRDWFESRLADPACAIYIAVNAEDRPLGQIRFELEGPERAEVDVSVAGEHRGRGLGSELIARGVERLTQETGVRRVEALVRVENVASHRAFEKAGFRRGEACEVRGRPALRWTRAAA